MMTAIAAFFKTWKFSLFGLLFLFFGISAYIYQQAERFSIASIQDRFTELELESQVYAKQILRNIKKGKELPKSKELTYHLYQKDILFGWNSNQLPIGRYKTAIFPGNGLIKLNNGYYFSHTVQKEDLTCCVSFCMLKSYEFSNAYLSATNPSFWKQQFSVSLTGEKKQAIYDSQKNVVFYASPKPQDNDAKEGSWGTFFILTGIFLLIYQLQKFLAKNWVGSLLLLLGLIVLRIILYELSWPPSWQANDWFSAGLFAFNEWNPDYFAFCINSVFIVFGLRIISALIRLSPYTWVYKITLVFPIVWWLWVLQQLQIVIDHSNIPLSFEHLFELRLSSYFFFALIGLYLHSFQQTVHFSAQLNRNLKWLNLPLLKFLLLSAPFVYLLVSTQNWINLLPLSNILLLLVFQKTNKSTWRRLSSQLLLLSINAAIISFYLQALQAQKDSDNRRLFAQQLSIERNINLELAYSQVAPNITEEKWLLTSFDSLKKQFTKVGFEHLITQKFFTGVWDGFEINADLYDIDQKPCFGTDTNQLSRLKDLVKKHGQASDIQDGLYFMPHEEEGLSYVILLKLAVDKSIGITLVSKRIPEEIGFPRLLISDQAGISNSLESYAIGKYAEGRLIHQTGTYNYPNSLSSFVNKNQDYLEMNGFSHIIVQRHKGSAIVISSELTSWLTNVTSFAFMFVFWGLILLANNISKTFFNEKSLQWSLSFKVQLAFLLILAVSLFLYGLGSTLFIGRQFDTYSQQALREKLSAVQAELRNQTFLLDTLDQTKISKGLETKLARLSNVFKTDLFVFDSDGFLIASSRPKLFAYGLIGEHMNPRAMDALIGENQSYFSHQDQIGKLSYRSAYLPIMNQQLKQIGFINLQLFGQQEAYEQQIEQFFRAAINVFILLLALSVLIALVVSNWLIGPLQTVARSVRNLELGKSNQKISYHNDDEIGALVKAYNEKLAELELAASQIARSERESAWRELAQQIAHEIKNPLTPMKLHIQHLLRKLDANDADVQQQAQKTLPGLIEQIDTLARMANEFARFAKLPEPIFEHIELNVFIAQATNLFDETGELIQFQAAKNSVWVSADKDMLSQVFHNLLQNAKQATESNNAALIIVQLQIENDKVKIRIQDNGVGISSEQQAQIFTPYFTTKSSGSGIGLSVVKQIIEKHNGKVRFESTLGEGTTFFIELNLARNSA
ncbi:MAG: ATP-binding protein [Flavobacteriales bacterium]